MLFFKGDQITSTCCNLPRRSTQSFLCCDTIRTQCALFCALVRRSKDSRLHAQSTTGCRVPWSHGRGMRSTWGIDSTVVSRKLSSAVSSLVFRGTAWIPSHWSAMINTFLDRSTYKTCLFTLGSSLTSPILESRALSSWAVGRCVAWVSVLAGAPNLTSSYLSPPGLRTCREMP